MIGAVDNFIIYYDVPLAYPKYSQFRYQQELKTLDLVQMAHLVPHL